MTALDLARALANARFIAWNSLCGHGSLCPIHGAPLVRAAAVALALDSAGTVHQVATTAAMVVILPSGFPPPVMS